MSFFAAFQVMIDKHCHYTIHPIAYTVPNYCRLEVGGGSVSLCVLVLVKRKTQQMGTLEQGGS